MIFRERRYLVIQGVVKVDELDDIVTSSIGLRWAADGPFRSFHLGGGAGGFKSFFKQFGPGLNEAWKNMAPVNLDEAAQDKIIAQARRRSPRNFPRSSKTNAMPSNWRSFACSRR